MTTMRIPAGKKRADPGLLAGRSNEDVRTVPVRTPTRGQANPASLTQTSRRHWPWTGRPSTWPLNLEDQGADESRHEEEIERVLTMLEPTDDRVWPGFLIGFMDLIDTAGDSGFGPSEHPRGARPDRPSSFHEDRRRIKVQENFLATSAGAA